MKRFYCMLILFMYVLSVVACSSQPEKTFQSPVNFYYCAQDMQYNSETCVIRCEIRDTVALNSNDRLTEIINLYFKGPEDLSLGCPFPENLTLKRCTINGDILQVILSNHISSLKGYDLTLACACLTKTFLELTDASSVEIRAEGGRMGDSRSVTMSSETLLLLDTCTQADSTDP